MPKPKKQRKAKKQQPPGRCQPVIDFLYSLMDKREDEWPAVRAAGIPAEVEAWMAASPERQQDMAVVWGDVCREEPYEESYSATTSYVLEEFGAGKYPEETPLVMIASDVAEDCVEAFPYPERHKVGMAVIRLLLEAGVHPDEHGEDAFFGGPLHYACRWGYTELAELLLSYGASPNKTDVDEWTPLSEAIRAHSVELVRMLLAAGANPRIPDLAGYTPLWWAIEFGNAEIEALLHGAGARKSKFTAADWAKYSKK